MAALANKFAQKKRHILAQLSVPDADYDDLSPKGSVDAGIRDLIDEINARDGLVTTSSCAGRIAVFVEGVKKSPDDAADTAETPVPATKLAAAGGKGGGGRWLFVSHDPVDLSTVDDPAAVLGLQSLAPTELSSSHVSQSRLIHFKFEPMAGFRESGALNISSSSTDEPTPMVGIRSNGMAFESLVGVLESDVCLPVVSAKHLKALLTIANERFHENSRRIARFRELLAAGYCKASRGTGRTKANGEEWEDPAARRQRKRVEGLERGRRAS